MYNLAKFPSMEVFTSTEGKDRAGERKAKA